MLMNQGNKSEPQSLVGKEENPKVMWTSVFSLYNLMLFHFNKNKKQLSAYIKFHSMALNVFINVILTHIVWNLIIPVILQRRMLRHRLTCLKSHW